MLRLLALPVAVVAVLASSGCAAADDSATPGPDASAEQSPGATEPSSDEPSPAAPSGDGGAAGDATGSAEAGSSTPGALSSGGAGDPGVPGLPQQSGASVDDVLRLGAVASWAEQRRRIALSLPASSSCWAFAAAPVAQAPNRILVHVEQPEPCGALDAARTYSVAVPPGIDASADVELSVVGLDHRFTLTLPAG